MAVLNGCFVKLSALDNMLSKFKIMRIHFLVMWRDTLSPSFLLVQFQVSFFNLLAFKHSLSKSSWYFESPKTQRNWITLVFRNNNKEPSC